MPPLIILFTLLSLLIQASSTTLHPVFRSSKCPIRLPQSPTSKITNGDPAFSHLTPYLVSIFKDNEPHCTGTLISPQWFLSAAHCKITTADIVTVSQSSLNLHADRNGIEKVIPHPMYDSDKGRKYDVVAVKLITPVTSKVKFMSVNVNPKNPKPKSYVRVLGYGDIGEMLNNVDGTLNQVDVPVTSNEDCKKVYASIDTSIQMCAGYLGKGGCDSCQGDSGGPMLQYTSSFKPVLVGIVASGIGCARKDHPGIYSRTAAFVSWLDSIPDLEYEKESAVEAVMEAPLSKGAIGGIAAAAIAVGLVIIWCVWKVICKPCAGKMGEYIEEESGGGGDVMTWQAHGMFEGNPVGGVGGEHGDVVQQHVVQQHGEQQQYGGYGMTVVPPPSVAAAPPGYPVHGAGGGGAAYPAGTEAGVGPPPPGYPAGYGK